MGQDQAINDTKPRADIFAELLQRVEVELAALQTKHDRLEGFVKQLTAHANIKLEY